MTLPTALAQIAANALGARVEDIDLRIGDTNLPEASVEGGSSGITSWGTAISCAEPIASYMPMR